jgi:serine/threonine-protein kinase RsbT
MELAMTQSPITLNSSECCIAGEMGREIVRLPIAGVQDVLMIRLIARQEAARLGFAPQAMTQIATAVSEIVRNVVQHAGTAGQVRLFEAAEEERVGLTITVEDHGRGIADLDGALTGAAPGAGIPGCRKLMDSFTIRSSAGAGTAVTMAKWVRRG